MPTYEFDLPSAAYEALSRGMMRHDIRRIGDTPFADGDTVVYAEVDPRSGARTGRTLEAGISYVTWEGNKCALSDFGLRGGFAVLSLDVPETPAAAG